MLFNRIVVGWLCSRMRYSLMRYLEIMMIAEVDRNVARKYIEKIEGQPVKPFRVPPKVDNLLGELILSGGFDVE